MAARDEYIVYGKNEKVVARDEGNVEQLSKREETETETETETESKPKKKKAKHGKGKNKHGKGKKKKHGKGKGKKKHAKAKVAARDEEEEDDEELAARGLGLILFKKCSGPGQCKLPEYCSKSKKKCEIPAHKAAKRDYFEEDEEE